MARVQPDLRLRPLTRKQRKAVELLVAGYRKNEVIAELGISPATFFRWQKLPMWEIAVNEACRVHMDEAEVEVKSLTGLATKTLRTLVCTGTDQIKLGAARLIYETVDRLVAREQQQQVVVELEEQLEEQLEELKTLVAIQQAQLPGSSEPAIDAEITPIAHADAHVPEDSTPEASGGQR